MLDLKSWGAMIKCIWLLSNTNTRSFPGADIGSDHDFVLTITKLKLKSKCFTKSPRVRFDPEKLKDPKIVQVFQDKLGGMFEALCVLDRN